MYDIMSEVGEFIENNEINEDTLREYNVAKIWGKLAGLAFFVIFVGGVFAIIYIFENFRHAFGIISLLVWFILLVLAGKVSNFVSDYPDMTEEDLVNHYIAKATKYYQQSEYKKCLDNLAEANELIESNGFESTGTPFEDIVGFYELANAYDNPREYLEQDYEEFIQVFAREVVRREDYVNEIKEIYLDESEADEGESKLRDHLDFLRDFVTELQEDLPIGIPRVVLFLLIIISVGLYFLGYPEPAYYLVTLGVLVDVLLRKTR